METDGENLSFRAAFALLDNQAYNAMKATLVSDWINKPRNDDERCVVEVAIE